MPSPINLADYAALAAQLLPAPSWAYLNGSAADGLTDQRNHQAWRDLPLWPRVLRNTAGGNTRCRLFGRIWPSPLLVAPMAYQRLAHALGEQATALAAAMQGAGLVLSAQASTPVETVAGLLLPEQATRGPFWFQLYLQHDRGFTRDLVQRATDAGAEALVLTVDAPVHGVRDAERRSGFRLPADVQAVHLHGLPAAPARPLAPGGSALFDDLLHQAPTWDDVAWLLAHTRLPLLLKGVLHPADARQAQALGVAGLIVSNHGGRTLDTAVATAQALPLVRQVLGPSYPLLVDGGIRRGTDVLKALALGADAVLVGRPVLHGLAAGGAQGVAHVLRLLRDEFEAAMALTGCKTLRDIGTGLLQPAQVG